ncbi:S-adenosyl-L-methionine-dependent methyltransferase [Scenedesmus sp. NREL 46B-D3]|nr:S-adenosyl-L-methionine-dependent methyltransferase [Scenedesmus sp. NREL 46B-D3]
MLGKEPAHGNHMQTSGGLQEEPPLVEINHRGQIFETYIVRTDAVAEAAYLIGEVLVDDCYLQHGLQITPGATVVDIGANIGIFAVRALAAAPGGDLTYIGVEPVPASFTALQCNLLGGTGGNIMLFQTAVSDRPGTLPMTFYPRMPGNSTLRPLEKAALQQRLMPSFFSAVEQFEVPVVTLQRLLQEAVPDGGRIDLLKVDVEGEEWAVLQGLDEAGWQRVQQVVVEVHDCPPGVSDKHPASRSAADAAGSKQRSAPGGQLILDDLSPTAAAAAAGGACLAQPQPALLAAQPSADIDGHWISFLPRSLPSHDARGRPVMQAAAPPRHDGRVMAVARMLKGLGFKVVVDCCMLAEGVPVNHNVYALRPELSR